MPEVEQSSLPVSAIHNDLLEFFANANYGSDMASGTVLLLLLAFSSLSATQLMFTEEPSNASVEVGTPHALRCVAEVEGSPLVDITYSWLKDGQLFISNLTNGTLVIPSRTLEDAGSYTCVASYGPLSIQSRAATLTVTQPDTTGDQRTVIVISVSVTVIVLVLLGIVVCVWLLLCFRRSHIWDKAPMRPRVRHNVLYEEEEGKGYGYSPKTFPSRSKSLGHLKVTSHRAPKHHDGRITRSSQNLLYGSQPTEVTDVQDDLELDETLFEHSTSPHNKSYSENDVNEPSTPFLSDLDKTELESTPIDDYSKRQYRQGDPSHANRGQASRRTSNSSCLSDAQSDLSSDLIASQAGSSYLFKSVRFDIDDDSGLDSGIVTGTSTPSHPERRASAPEVKTKRSLERWGSAPECNPVHSNEDENDMNLSQPAVSDNEKMHDSGTECSELSTEQTQLSTVAESSSAGAPEIVTTHRERDGYNTQPKSPESIQLQADTTEEATSIATTEDDDHVPPAVTTPMDERQSTPKIAHLISAAEQWRDVSSSEVQKESKRHGVSRQRVAHMRQIFQQQKSDSVERSKQVTKQVSQLVTEKARVFQAQQQAQAGQPSSQPAAERPQKARVSAEQMQGALRSDSGSDLVSFRASGPLLNLSEDNKTAEGGEVIIREDSKPTETQASGEKVEGDAKLENDASDGGETAEESDGEDELMAQFERSRLATSIPVFTCPVNLSPWQPIHFRVQFTADQNDSLRGSASEKQDSDSDSDSSDDEMVQPLQMQTSFSSISPIGRKGLFSQRSRSPISPQVRFQLPGVREAKKIQSPAIEPFYRPQGFQKSAGSRLSSIPEETPEMCSSTHDIPTLHT